MTTDHRGSLRTKSWGQQSDFSVMDRFGMWLSERQIRKRVGGFRGKRIADIGCGYHAVFVKQILHEVAHATVLDLVLSEELKSESNLTAFEGPLPDTLERFDDGTLDVVLCNNVIEHLSKPKTAIEHMRRMLVPNGVLFLNVPSWTGKVVLETAAFRLGWTRADEIDDHKAYYAPRELWRLLVESGFKPSEIQCRKHKFGLNTYALCTKS
ncbi:MAG: methyltransferase domain-containing protein [Myxococcota bacterium]|nr:methyltransferase domain-containing protein [Myxococcota bacterium]